MASLRNEEEPQPGDFIQLLDPSGLPSDTHSRIRQILSYDRREELWEVKDSLGQTRIITATEPRTWLEVDW